MDLVERVAKHLHERQSMWPWDSVTDKKAKLTEARAAADVVLGEVERHLSAVQYDPAPYTALKARLEQLRNGL